ncbi:beta-N-acetylhexosaminidase [Sphingobacterium spiritivorum]|uniref:beta-N-acetylhexosaminidase n=1 Tax=Sphingobacterium spiritivorum TaxID=258 RepID=UPI003DA5D28E
MRKYLIFSFLLCFTCVCAAQVQNSIRIIPQPQSVLIGDGFLKLQQSADIWSSGTQFAGAVQYLQQEVLKNKSATWFKGDDSNKALIHFVSDTKVSEEGYVIRVAKDKVEIRASTGKGALYGAVSLLQMILTTSSRAMELPYCEIKDQPAYGWRGFMLDESRHFFGKQKVKSLLDWMAFYKLNKFHWHLTDEPAWRLEILRYPLLTLVGGVGSFTNATAAAQYYQQADIEEIVRYAADRNIEVIPEIDMPGHATAANRAYPQYSGGGNDKHPDFTFHPGKEGTYGYLTHILKEANVLFPARMLHLGGDEVSFGSEAWNNDAQIKELKAKNQLADNKQVETYFMRRMADSVYSMGAKVLAWDEMADAGLPKDKTILMWWRHDKPDQLKTVLQNGYPAILCPRLPLYFDFVQEESHRYGRKWGKGFNALSDVYHFRPSKYDSLTVRKDQILGIQANLWTETVTNTNRLDYLIFPRLAAMAEVAWSTDKVKSFDRFCDYLPAHLKLYRAADLYYFDPFNKTNPEPVVYKTQRAYIDNPE